MFVLYFLLLPGPKPPSVERRQSSVQEPHDLLKEKEKESVKDRRQSTDGGKFASLQRWLKGDDGKKPERPTAAPKYDEIEQRTIQQIHLFVTFFYLLNYNFIIFKQK